MAPVTIKKKVMTTWDYLVEDGRQEEREKAVRNLVKQAVLSDQQIASVMEVSVEYIASIRQVLEDEK